MRSIALFVVLLVGGCSAPSPVVTSRPHAARTPLAIPAITVQARRLLLGEGAVPDVATAFRLYAEQCLSHHDPASCVVTLGQHSGAFTGDSLPLGAGIERTLRRRCRSGDAWACGWAAEAAGALSLAETCEPGHEFLCPADLEAMCDEDVPYACNWAADILRSPTAGHTPTAEESSRALALRERACELGASDACRVLSGNDRSSPYWPKYVAAAERACLAGWAGDCDVLAGVGAKNLCRLSDKADCIDPTGVPVELVYRCLAGDMIACRWAPISEPGVEEAVRKMGCALEDMQCVGLVSFELDVRHDLEAARSFVYARSESR